MAVVITTVITEQEKVTIAHETGNKNVEIEI